MSKNDTVHTSQEFAEVGKILADARKEKGLSIEKVAARIHIRKLYLRSIEAGDLDSLPGGIYTIGFVKVYSRFLGLDSGELLRRLDAEDIPIRQPEEPSFEPERLAEIFNESNLPSKKTMLISGAGLAVIVLVVSVWNLLPYSSDVLGTDEQSDAHSEIVDATDIPGEEGNTSSLGVAPPTKIPGTVTDLETDNDGGRLRPDKANKSQNTKTTKNDQAPSSSQSKASETQANNGVVSTGDEAGNGGTAASEQDSEFFATADANASVSGNSESSANKSGRVTLKATQASWVRIRDTTEKNKIILTKTLQPGEEYSLPKQKGLTIHTGNAGGIDVFIGGKRLGPLGASAQIARKISLNSSDLKKRITPSD